ncbi:MAG: hypothetical protein A2901_09520 [Elusimicrobia bacterium RIFCSPLOWO2_01_FULL_54_10]|nr:MAG: hypothetical protein A2901_09520 [Elusimicrobia bacterium RIFCSPLOWO2_01_FULL_54_10]
MEPPETPPSPPPPPPPPPRPRPGQGGIPHPTPGRGGAPRPRPFGIPADAKIGGEPPVAAPPPPPPPFRHKKIAVVALGAVLLIAVAYVALIFISRNTIETDGKILHHYSFSKGTVRDILSQFDIVASTKDISMPGLDQKVQWGQKIRLVRVVETFEKKKEHVDFVLDWKSRTSKNLRLVEVQNGHMEDKIWFVKRVFHDGREVESQESPKVVRKSSVQRLVLLNSLGRPEKIYTLPDHQKMSVVATAYWKGDPQVPGVITYSGHKVERGLVAVDPKVIPLGWRLYIPGYGYAYSSDTGSKIKGKRVDLFVENKKASKRWEYNKVTVYLLEKSKKW